VAVVVVVVLTDNNTYPCIVLDCFGLGCGNLIQSQ
jgi:hypothetical protein